MADVEFHNLRKQLKEANERLSYLEDQNNLLKDEANQMSSKLLQANATIEELKQNNYSTRMNLATTQYTLETCTAELETLQTQLDQQSSSTDKKHSEELELLRSKVLRWEQKCDEAEVEAAQLKEQLSLNQEQLKQARDAMFNNTPLGDTLDQSTAATMCSQIATLTGEKQELETKISTMESEHKALLEQMSRLHETMKEMNADLETKECTITKYYNEVERHKEEILELQEELDHCKMNEKDPKGKGNSLFAEVEDHRLFLEKKMLSMKSSYNILKKHYDLAVEKNSGLRLQVASLLSLSGMRNDSEYVQHLNDSLQSAQIEIKSLQEEIRDLTKRLEGESDRQLVIKCQPQGCASRSSYLINTFEATKKELIATKKTLQETRFRCVFLDDQLLQLKRKLHNAECASQDFKAQFVRAKVKIEELQSQKGILPETPVTVTIHKETLPDDDDIKKKVEEKELTRDKHQISDRQMLNANDPFLIETSQRAVQILTVHDTETASKPENTEKEKASVKDSAIKDITDDVVEEKQSSNIDPQQSSSRNKENCGPRSVTSDSEGRKAKRKCVRMKDVVNVHENTGVFREEALKTTENGGKMKRPRKLMVEAPPEKQLSEEAQESIQQCKQQ